MTKTRNVQNADDVDKSKTDKINPMGYPEQTVKQPGKPVKRVLNELEPERQDDIDEPLRLQEFAIMTSRISEAVQDSKGVSGDFMTKMGDKTSRLGAKQKNTGAAIEKCCDSTSGEPCDGITTHLKDMNLKTKQKNIGGGFETVNTSHSAANDGITSELGGMGSELGQNSKQKNKGSQCEVFKGSKNTMTSEEWSLGNIANIMEGDNINLQSLFDHYSKNSSYICLEDFQTLCNAHGVQTILSEQNLKALMSASRKFMFYEGNDATGSFWQAQPISEMVDSGAVADVPVEEDDNDFSEDEVGDEDEVEDEVEVGDEDEVEVGDEIGDEDYEDEEVEIGDEEPDDLADIFQQIGDDFSQAANLIAGESDETEEDENLEDDLPFDDGVEGGEVDNNEEGVEEEVCEDSSISGEPTSSNNGDLMNRIGSSVRGKATSVAMKGREEDEKNKIPASHTNVNLDREKEQDTDSVDESKCHKCGTILDESGCIFCDLLREMHGTNGLDAKADADGHYTSDNTKETQGELSNKIPQQETCDSTSGAPSDGITSEVPGKQTPLKPKMTNTGGQAAFKGGSGTMKENIMRLSHTAKEAVINGAKNIGRVGKYTVKFGVQSEGSTAVFPTLTDALTVVEELLQVCNSNKIVLEALYGIPHQKSIVYRYRLPIAKTKRRDPISCEGKILFRTAKVASAFADRVVLEGVACRVCNHNWGAAVTGRFNWPTAQKAFSTMSEAWGSQIRTPVNGSVGHISNEPEYGTESDLCPNCGNVEALDDSGICHQCGQSRKSAESDFDNGEKDDFVDSERLETPRRQNRHMRRGF